MPEILVVDQNHVTALTSHVDVENTLDCLVSVSLVWELYLFIKVILLRVGFSGLSKIPWNEMETTTNCKVNAKVKCNSCIISQLGRIYFYVCIVEDMVLNWLQ